MPVRGKKATGIRTTMVISDVIRMGRSRMGPAVRIASSRGIPRARRRRTRATSNTATVIIIPVRMTMARVEPLERFLHLSHVATQFDPVARREVQLLVSGREEGHREVHARRAALAVKAEDR